VGRRNLHGTCECPKEADLGLVHTGRDLDGTGRVGWVTNADFYSPVRVVFKAAQEEMVELPAKEEAKGGIINDVCMDFKHNIADLHGQIFIALTMQPLRLCVHAVADWDATQFPCALVFQQLIPYHPIPCHASFPFCIRPTTRSHLAIYLSSVARALPCT